MGISNKKKRHGPISGVTSDINVTPMADIMLVLLIIFMITTPMLQKGITVNLPKGTNGIKMLEADKREALVVGKDLYHAYFRNKSLDLEQLKNKLITGRDAGQTDLVYLKCDQKVTYKDLVGILEVIRDAGFEKIGLLIDQKK